jgi:hypothetical protein
MLQAKPSKNWTGVVVVSVALLGVLAAIGLRRDDSQEVPDSYLYDLTELRKTDPRLILYRETQRLGTGFRRAFAIAISNDGLPMVAVDQAIRVFDESGRVVLDIPLSGQPTCLAYGPGDQIYVGIRDHIEVFDEKGALCSRWDPPGDGALLTSIAVSDKGVFVADAGRRVVIRYAEDGSIIRVIDDEGSAGETPRFVIPHPQFDLAVGKDGDLHIANPGRHRVEKYTVQGLLSGYWGAVSMGIEGFAGCGNPANFSLLSDGRYVTCEKGLPRVKIYSPEGVFAGVVAGAELFPKYNAERISTGQIGELDVAVDAKDRILVLDSTENSVRVFVENSSKN